VDQNTLRFLNSDRGRELMKAVRELPGDSISKQEKLRRDFPAVSVRAALTLADLREHARRKFERADEMYFDRDGLEQASGDVIAQHRAKRYAAFDRVADLCCGVGGDSAALASVVDLVSVDIRPARAAMTRANVEPGGHCSEVVCADVRHWRPSCNAVFIDPSRRESGRRVTKLSSYAPSVEDLTWMEPATAIGIKVAPGIDHADLPDGCEVEFISVDGECREAVLWMGGLRSDADVRATVLPSGISLVRESFGPVECGPVGAYLYEPDRAVIRAHLVDQVAAQIGGHNLDPQVAYLTGDELIETPFARAYRVREVMAFSMKRLQAYVNTQGIGRIEIKKRRFPMTPDAVRKKLKLKGSESVTLVLTRIGENATAIFCDPV
jgi:hypothetical protein